MRFSTTNQTGALGAGGRLVPLATWALRSHRYVYVCTELTPLWASRLSRQETGSPARVVRGANSLIPTSLGLGPLGTPSGFGSAELGAPYQVDSAVASTRACCIVFVARVLGHDMEGPSTYIRLDAFYVRPAKLHSLCSSRSSRGAKAWLRKSCMECMSVSGWTFDSLPLT